jgi:hypothetical protein
LGTPEDAQITSVTASKAAAWRNGKPDYELKWPECQGVCNNGNCMLRLDQPACCFVQSDASSNLEAIGLPQGLPQGVPFPPPIGKRRLSATKAADRTLAAAPTVIIGSTRTSTVGLDGAPNITEQMPYQVAEAEDYPQDTVVVEQHRLWLSNNGCG